MRANDTALVVIDMQNDVVESMVPTGVEVIAPIKRALAACRGGGIPVVFCSKVHRPDGSDVERSRLAKFRAAPYLVRGTRGAEIVTELQPLPAELQVTKSRFSSFFQTDLLMLLTRLNVTTLAVCGIQTPNCIRATVTDALSYDFDTIVLDDATVALTPEIHTANIFDMKNMGARVMTTDGFISDLTAASA